MNYLQSLNCSQWQFEFLPEFCYGKMSPVFACCGTGLSDDSAGTPEDSSYMHIFAGTNAKDVSDYSRILRKSGFNQVYQKEIEGNLFYQFETDEGLLYISFLNNSGVTRIILDRCSCVPVSAFGCPGEEKNKNTVFAQYSLFYDKMIKGTTCDCGMNYVFRLRDNSLIIVDGGEIEQSTDVAVKDYMSFLRELTGTVSGEKITVSLWICTHAHNDHLDFFAKLLRLYRDEIQVERAAFNFPDPQNTRCSESVKTIRQRLAGYYPDIKYMKVHAGEAFNIANAKITVLTSNEDTTAIDPEDPFDGCNATSCVFTVEADGAKVLFLADTCDSNAGVLLKNYPAEMFRADFLQAAHHGINAIYNMYETVEAKTVLLPQCMMNMETRFSEIYSHLCERFGEENILPAFNQTDIFTLSDGAVIHTGRPRVGTAYDGTEI